MNKRLIGVVKNAIKQDNSIITDKTKIEEAKGFTEQYMAYLGLSRNDLKKLERAGLAMRGMTQLSKKNPGYSIRWTLLGDGNGT